MAVGGIAVAVGVIVATGTIEIYAGIDVESTFSLALSADASESTCVLLPNETVVGVLVVAPIAVSVNVPTFVVVLIDFVASDPIDNETSTLLVVRTGPSRVAGKAAVLTAKEDAPFAWNFVGSYCISSFTVDGKLLPGLIMTSKETVLPTCF